MDGRFTDEELAIAKSVDLCAVAESLGYTVKRIGKYHTLKEMDSIRIYNRSHWYRWSRQFDKGNNGGSQIDFLQSIFYYVWLEVQPAKRNFETVLKLLGEAEVTEQGKASKLDVRMKFLEESSPLGANHPAVKQYNKCMRGAGDTVRSIIISANSRLAFLENKQVLRLLSKDELNLSDIGIGVNGDGETKTALFCVIPDSDKSYNFIIGMLYTQIFQELYYQAAKEILSCSSR